MTETFHPITPRYIQLGIAVKITDAFTHQLPLSEPVLFLNGKPVKSYGNNQTGYWATPEAEYGQWELVVKARYYFPSPPLTIDLKPNDKAALRRFRVQLEPRPNYPYPRGTMIRGLVTGIYDKKTKNQDPKQGPLPGVLVEASYESTGNPIQTFTDNEGRYDGRYALYLNDHRERVEVTLSFSKEGHVTRTQTVKTRYMETTFHNIFLP